MLHVAIDARLPDAGQGGVLSVVKAMAAAFKEHGADIRRTWVVAKQATWWRGSLPDGDSTLEVSVPAGSVAAKLPTLSSRLAPAVLRVIGDRNYLDAAFQEARIDVVHLPYQDGVRTALPFVYFPHDLQHVHLPSNFTLAQIQHRETRWRRRAQEACGVVAAGPHVKRDLVEYWDVDPQKISVFPFPPARKPAPAEVSPYAFTEPFIIYPAVFWPHKNHRALIEAFSLVRSRGQKIRLVLTGAKNTAFISTMRRAAELGVDEHVHYFGHVSESELGRLIADSRAVVIPSLFEAVSLTAFDAMNLNRPIVCSDREFFRYQCADNATYFDPQSPESMADAIVSVLSTPGGRIHLANPRSSHPALSLGAFAANLCHVYESCAR